MAKKKFEYIPSDNTDVTPADIRAAKKEARKRKKFEKKELKRLKKEYDLRTAVIPPTKRPLICPPDCSDIPKSRVVIGMALRILIITVAVIGVTLFVSEAFGFDMTAEYLKSKKVEGYSGVAAGASFSFILPWAMLFVGALSLCALWKYGKLIGIPVILAVSTIITLPDPIRAIYEAALTAYNGALGHMRFMGFLAIDLKRVEFEATVLTPEKAVQTAVIFFTLICSLVFVPFFIKRAKLLVPGIFSAAIMVFIFVYNLSRSNLALTLIISSFCAMTVMSLYDKTFIKKPKKNSIDDTGNVFGETDEPPLPERLLNRKAAKAAKKTAKAEKKKEAKLKKDRTVTVDEEISDYFASSKPSKTRKVKLTPAQKRQEAAAKKEAKAQKREQKAEDKRAIEAVRRHRRNILLRRSSFGGFAGAGMLILCLIVLVLPAMSAKGSFETIPAIDEKLEYYREYITALLMGDDPALDLLAYEGDADNFSPRDTTARPIYYKHEPLMTVESSFASPIYLRGWIATDYSDGMWLTAEPNSETLEDYRALFASNDDASESIYYNFFCAMTDDGYFEPDRDVTDRIKRLDKYGYSIAQVNIKRVEDFEDILLYMPSFHIRSYSPVGTSKAGSATNFLRKYGSSDPSEISYANFFDGIYTSYRVGKDGTEGYAAVAMLTNMRNESFYYNTATLIAEYNQTRLAVANGRTVIESDPTDSRLGKFSVTLYDGTVVEYNVISVAEDGTKTLTIAQPVGTAVYILKPDGTVTRSMTDVPEEYDRDGNLIEYFAPKLDLAVQYFEGFSSSRKWQFNRQAELLDRYTPFVYETYTKKSGSTIITQIYRDIVANAVVKEEYKDPVPADFSKAAFHSKYNYNKKKDTYTFETAVTDRDTYIQRHELVMEILKYLCDEENFTYTLTPTVLGEENTLDGVETFLTKTHEGYCVQYASSLVLLLREAGIPARYVEGYIATGFIANRDKDAVSRYKTTVRDDNAHAWVEVWYDGLGWVQYEATPEYFDAMYVSERPDTNIRPPSSGSTSTDPEDEYEDQDPPIEDTMTEYEYEQWLAEQRREEMRALMKKIAIIAGSVFAALTLITVILVILIKRARHSARKRAEILSELYMAKEGSVPDRETVEKAGDMLMKLLARCGFLPDDGEFRSEFAMRIAKECSSELSKSAPVEGLTEFESTRHPLRESDIILAFEAIAAEEFGHGASAQGLPEIAKLYYRLRCTLYRRRVPLLRRISLYLIKRES